MATASARPAPWRRWALRGVGILLALELVWLLVVNGALALPATQDWLNTLRPEKVRLSWERAWSWYPGRVMVEGVVVSGQTPRNQWQAEADRVRGNVALLPLAFRHVKVSHGVVENGRYRQRPRPEPGGADIDGAAHFPPISGYELTPREDLPPPRPVWTTTVSDARLTGNHHLWIHRVQAAFGASARADLTVRSQGGPLDLDVPEIDLSLERTWADGATEILSGGTLTGSYHLGPYAYREHRGLHALRFMDLDADLALETEGLEFLQLFLQAYPDLETGGRGQATGRLVVRDGRVRDGTDLRVDAADLSVAVELFRVVGAGVVHLLAGPDGPLPFRVGFLFDELVVRHRDDDSVFFTGRGLEVDLDNDGDLVPPAGDESSPRDYRASLGLGEARVEDMVTFNRYLPARAPMAFAGGSAELGARIVLTPEDATGDFTLQGSDLRATLQDQELGLDLLLDGTLAGGVPRQGRFDLAGTRLVLDRAWVLGQEDRAVPGAGPDWNAQARFSEADLVLSASPDLTLTTDLTVSDTRPLAAVFRNNGGPDWIARRMTVEDLSGAAQLVLKDRRLTVPDAHLGAETLEVGMRGAMGEPANSGRIYLRYKRLDAMLRFEDGDRDIVLIGPRKQFDAYAPPEPD